MSNAVRRLIKDYNWIHLGVGLAGNLMFFAGSLLFLPAFEHWKPWGVRLFVVGSFAMFARPLGFIPSWNVDRGGEIADQTEAMAAESRVMAPSG